MFLKVREKMGSPPESMNQTFAEEAAEKFVLGFLKEYRKFCPKIHSMPFKVLVSKDSETSPRAGKQ